MLPLDASLSLLVYLQGCLGQLRMQGYVLTQCRPVFTCFSLGGWNQGHLKFLLIVYIFSLFL